jgi:three-Cys-motif partner protein
VTSQLIARDGLRARDSGTWARDKLSFLDEFGPPALTATTRKHQRCYIDLFAGPGLNIDRSTGEEFDGSPLRILGMTSSIDPDIHFTHAVFVNKTEADHEALAVRVDRCCAEGRSFIPRERIGIRHGDANIVIRDIMATIPALAYVLLFADIEAPKQFPWSSVLDIKRLGHASVDLYILFPLEMAIQRLIAFQGAI